MILEDLYRGKYAPIESMAVHNDHDRLTRLQEEIVAALPEEKKALADATQDAFLEMVMDEGSSFCRRATTGRQADDESLRSKVIEQLDLLTRILV